MAVRPDRSKHSTRKLLSWSLVFLLALLLVLVRFVNVIDFDVRPDDRFVIARVIDGDSVELRGGDRLRLLAIDTPEKGERLFDEAKQFLFELAIGEVARIVYPANRRDKYGRLLGYLYVDSIFVNKSILEAGLGYLYLFKNNQLESAETKALLMAQRKAMKRKIGLWALERHPEEFYVNVVGSFRLHRPGCRSVQNLKAARRVVYDTREDALRLGLSPCRNCRP